MREGWFEGADGTRLYYRTVGEGIPLLLNDGIGCAGYVWRYFIPYFQDRYQIVHWNYKGHGVSDKPLTMNHVGIEDLARDVGRLCEHLDLPPVVMVGHSMGVQVVYEFARQFPERVRGLVPMCGSYGRPLDTFHDNSLLKTVFPGLRKLFHMKPRLSQTLWTTITNSELAYQVATHFEVNGSLLKREDFKPYFDHISQVDVELFAEMLGRAQEHDAKPFLPQIEVPVLIIGGERDTFTPVWLSKDMQRIIPDADLLIVPGGSHTAVIEMPEYVNLRVEKFLREKIDAAEKPKQLKAAAKKTSAAKATKSKKRKSAKSQATGSAQQSA